MTELDRRVKEADRMLRAQVSGKGICGILDELAAAIAAECYGDPDFDLRSDRIYHRAIDALRLRLSRIGTTALRDSRNVRQIVNGTKRHGPKQGPSDALLKLKAEIDEEVADLLKEAAG
jgi:hypothetical protein